MAGQVLRRFSAAFTDADRKRKSIEEPRGAAIPYPEPEPSTPDDDLPYDHLPPHVGLNGDPIITKRSISTISGSSRGSNCVALCRLDSSDPTEVAAWREEVREAVDGRETVRLRGLLADADPELIDGIDYICTSALLASIAKDDVETIDVILDYLTSADKETRNAFVLVRASTFNGEKSYVERYSLCTDLKPFSKRGVTSVQLLVCHGQKSEDVAIFLYSILDVPVASTFILHSSGDVNMKNFQRYETKALPEVLNLRQTRVRSFELTGYHRLRTLVLTSCGLSKVTLQGLPCLKHLDLRKNQLTGVPEGIADSRTLRVLRLSGNLIRKLPDSIGGLDQLVELDCSGNHLKRLTPYIVNCSQLTILRCSDNDLVELPLDLGLLSSLEELVVHNNRLDQLPLSVASLVRLQRLSFYDNPLQNIPSDFPERPMDVRKYFQSLQDHPVRNRVVKLVVVGQEGVGKTTLVRALRKTFWKISRNSTSRSSDKKDTGIHFKDIQMDDFSLRCFDCSGDVDFNETHNFFMSPGAIYLACFNISEYCLSTVERNSFLLGRLRLWLQYICSRVPNAQVLLVGTHADHSSITRPVLEEIWDQLRKLLAEERSRHQDFFRETERLYDCLLCQSDGRTQNHSPGGGSGHRNGFVNPAYESPNESSEGVDTKGGRRTPIAFPHIVGYYKVSSLRGSVTPGHVGSPLAANPGVESLKEAIRELALRMIRTSPEIPQRWADVRETLRNHVARNPDSRLMTVERIRRFAEAHGINDRTDLVNMLHFFRAQGSLLYLPRLSDLEEIVVLDQEWLARIFASVVSSKSSPVDEFGMVDRNRLKDSLTGVGPQTRERVLVLLRYFGLCFPIDDTQLELFPSKLPYGDPDRFAWPPTPRQGQRQVTHSMTFISSIPPPFFNNLMTTVYSHRASPDALSSAVTEDGVPGGATVRPVYYSNLFLETLRPDHVGCRNCGFRRTGSADGGDVEDLNLIHQVLFELVPHRRSIQVTARGAMPCCLMRKISRMFVKVVHSYEGLQNLSLDSILCPVCIFENHPRPHRFSLSSIETSASEDVDPSLECLNGHSLPSRRMLLSGTVDPPQSDSPRTTPRRDVNRIDYSGCPRLFVVLPVSQDGTTISRDLTLFSSSLVFDGYAAHFLCEFPHGYHVAASPGFRLANPKEFMRVHGSRVLAILRLLSRTSGSSVSTSSVRVDGATVDSLVRDLTTRFPVVKDTTVSMTTDGLRRYVDEDDGRIRRDELRKMLRLVDQADCFGPLVRFSYRDRFIWLCHGHYRQMELMTNGSNGEAL